MRESFLLMRDIILLYRKDVDRLTIVRYNNLTIVRGKGAFIW